MDEVLLFLFKKNGHRQPVRLSTAELGSELEMSQQNASRRLRVLEKDGYAKRSKGGILLTKKAYDEIASVYGILKNTFEDKEMTITGIVTKGLGEGKYYLAMGGYRKQIREKLGFDPFPGTLNIRIDEMWKRKQLLQFESIVIMGFKDKERTYGDLFAYRCKIEGLECAVIVPLRTHHGTEILEVIGPFNIRKKLGKKDGDSIMVVI
ncbi:CTP-dependent riboflavin kinase [Candidatus Micrarchaeota archaeon]|nr:CTP-dependent riboflavin kinase [Candidatus Micrarchaeota archaeon]